MGLDEFADRESCEDMFGEALWTWTDHAGTDYYFPADYAELENLSEEIWYCDFEDINDDFGPRWETVRAIDDLYIACSDSILEETPAGIVLGRFDNPIDAIRAALQYFTWTVFDEDGQVRSRFTAPPEISRITERLSASDDVTHSFSRTIDPTDMHEQYEEEALEIVNETINASLRTWLMIKGLVASANEVAGDTVRTSALDAMFIEAKSIAEEMVATGEEVIDDPSGAIDVVGDLTESRRHLERICRDIAQVVLGITSIAVWNPASASLERAAVVVVTDSESADLDGLCTEFRARTADDLLVEISGLLCRLLLGSYREVQIATAGAPIVIRGGAAATLHVEHDDESIDWKQPVTVLEPAKHLVQLIAATQ